MIKMPFIVATLVFVFTWIFFKGPNIYVSGFFALLAFIFTWAVIQADESRKCPKCKSEAFYKIESEFLQTYTIQIPREVGVGRLNRFGYYDATKTVYDTEARSKYREKYMCNNCGHAVTRIKDYSG